jgi:peptidoglycan/xylan/chitin deacetylase (PgdA/CDA1 family)
MVKFAYLTIDDGPSPDFKQKIDFLFSKKIPAIFFCRGQFLKERPDFAIYAIKKGFIIGSHSYNHPHFSKLTTDECLEQIERTDEIIDDIYKKANVKRPLKVFRFPYGDKGGGDDFELGWPESATEHIQSIQNILKRFSYKQPKFEGITYNWYKNAKLEKDADVVWTYDTHDWRLRKGLDTIEDLFKRMEENLPEQCRGLNYPSSTDIILIHDHVETTQAFVKIIERLLEKGIKFVLPKDI